MTSPSPKTNVNDSKTSTLVPSSSFPSTLIVTTSLLIGLLAFLGAFDRICKEDLFRFQSDIFLKHLNIYIHVSLSMKLNLLPSS